ncbi:MAG: serine protease, partial [Anaerolineaceae bacterium]
MASDGKLNALVGLSSELADLVERAAGVVYSVDARRKFPASGFAISENHILTADHVIEREEGLFAGDGKEKYAAALVGRDPHHDLALLSIAGVPMSPLPNGVGDTRVGGLAIALARPGKGIQASLGLISSIGAWPSRRENATIPAVLRAEVTPHP